jgi:hypothetical protein
MIGTAYLDENGRVERVRAVLPPFRRSWSVAKLLWIGAVQGFIVCAVLMSVALEMRQSAQTASLFAVFLQVPLLLNGAVLVAFAVFEPDGRVELRPLAVTPRRGPPIPWTAIAEVRCVEDIRRRGRSWSILVVAPDGAATPLIRRAFRSPEDAAPFVDLLRRFPQSDEAERRRLVDGLTLRFPRGYRGGLERSASAG